MSSPRHSASAMVARLLGPSRWAYALAVACLAGGILFGYSVPLISRAAVDAVMPSADAADYAVAGWLGGRAFLANHLQLAFLLVALAALFSGALLYAKGRLTAVASENAIRRLRTQLYDHLQRLSCRFHDRSETGDLVQRCTSDMETTRLFLTTQLMEIVRAALMLLVVVPIMLALDVPMTLVSLAGIPLLVGFGWFFFNWIRPSFQQMDEAEGRMTTTLQENLTGIRVVRAFARQQHEEAKFARANGQYRDRHYRLIRIISIYWPVSDLLVFAQQAAVLAFGAYWVAAGRISIGTLVAFFLIVNMYVWPLRMFGRIITEVGKALVSLKRIDEVLCEPIEPVAPLTPAQPLQGDLDFRNLSFAYGGSDGDGDAEAVLRELSATIRPGACVAIVGPSGAGKSTLMRLLLRLYDGLQGDAEVDGHALQDLDRHWLRSQIAVVMQDPFLYSKSVRENLAMAREQATLEEMHEAARIADVHDTIVAMPEGYDTVIGERGVNLSGGQRQRLALARALLARPALLILDDALSAVDSETEARILQRLSQHSRQHERQPTTLIIAHRLSTVRQADQILVMDQGRLEQAGTHEQLVGRAGPYRRTWLGQSAEQPRELLGHVPSSETPS